MAADQLNNRYKVSNAVHHTSWEMQRVKRKKFSHYESDTKSRISLEWDDKKERVVSKKEQIGIASRELTPCLPCANYRNVLGDVFTAPPELFELNNLTGLLSYEVWQSHLSVQERKFLTQFLPEGADPHKIVHELLAGNNFYLGNPFQKWGASVCSGDYHPDVILRQEQRNKANKIVYYSELNEYHTNMIGSLQSWKERLASCMNPEDFMQSISRPRRDFHKSGPSHENSIQNGLQHELGMSGSCSWGADDKLHNTDSPDLSVSCEETLTRVSRTDLGNKHYDSSGGRLVARPKKGNKLHKLNVECGDGAKYMSYIKVSKEQHEQVISSMKQSNVNIQPKSHNNVLGDLDSFCVQPYEVFEEEERQRLHNYWLHLVKKALPAGFENWNSWRSAKWQIGVYLRKEIEDKWKPNDKPVLNLYTHLDDASKFVGQDKGQEQEQSNDEQQIGETNDEPVMNLYDNPDDKFIVVGQDEEQEQSNDEQQIGERNDVLSIAPSDDVLLVAPSDGPVMNLYDNADDKFIVGQDEEQEQEQLHDEQHVGEINDVLLIAPEETMEQDDESVWQSESDLNAENHENTNEASRDSDQRQHLPLISMHNETQDFCHMAINTNDDAITGSEAFPSSLVDYPQNINHTNAPVERFSTPSEATEIWQPVTLPNEYYHLPASGSQDYSSISQSSFLHRQSDGRDSFYNPYVNTDRNELPLRSFFKDPGNSHYLQTSQFPRNLTSSLPLDPRQENIFADERYFIPRQENLLPLNQVNDWPGNGGVNLVMSATSHHRLSQNCFSKDEVVRDRWAGGVVPNHDIGNGGQVVDEGLFSVLSGLRSGAHYGSTDLVHSGGYVRVGREPVLSTIANGRGSGVNYMSGSEGELGWMNM